jgi:hypothetical protein
LGIAASLTLAFVLFYKLSENVNSLDDKQVVQNTLNMWTSIDKDFSIRQNSNNVSEKANKSIQFYYSTHYHHQKKINLDSKKRKLAKLDHLIDLEKSASILDKINEAVLREKDHQMESPHKKRKMGNNYRLDELNNQPMTSYQANKQSNESKQLNSLRNQKLFFNTINPLIKGSSLKCQSFKNQISLYYNNIINYRRDFYKYDDGSTKHPLYEFSKYFKPKNFKIASFSIFIIRNLNLIYHKIQIATNLSATNDHRLKFYK